MSTEATQVLIAGYLSKEGALLDYQAVVDTGVKIDVAVCVSRDLVPSSGCPILVPYSDYPI